MADRQKVIQAELCDILSDDQAAYRALNESQFVPFFQPLVTLRTGQLAGFEVLARSQHPTAGLIPPINFIPKAEKDGWIGALTQQILEKAFAVASVIPCPLTLAINVSPLHLRDLRLPEQIHTMSAKAGFSIHWLVVEITESTIIEDLQSAVKMVAELKRLGCGQGKSVKNKESLAKGLLHAQALHNSVPESDAVEEVNGMTQADHHE